MTFDIRDFMSPDPRIACSSCGEITAVAVVTQRRRGDFNACPRCHAEYERQCAANRKDEERERAEAQERSKRAAERDAERQAKQRSTGNRSVA